MEENGDKSRMQWILDGYAKEGIEISDPPEDEEILKLLDIVADISVNDRRVKRYLTRNVKYIYRKVPQEHLKKLIAGYVDASEPGEKKAVISYLIFSLRELENFMSTKGTSDLLKRITNEDFGTDFWEWNGWYGKTCAEDED